MFDQFNAGIASFACASHYSLTLVVGVVHSFGSAKLSFESFGMWFLGFLPCSRLIRSSIWLMLIAGAPQWAPNCRS